MFNNLCLDYSNKPHNPLLNSGAIMSSALLLHKVKYQTYKTSSLNEFCKVKPEMPMSEKFDLLMTYFNKMAGGTGQCIGFNNSVFLSERDTADRNFALAYFMKENKCFPQGFNLQETLDFYFQVRYVSNSYHPIYLMTFSDTFETFDTKIEVFDC